MNASEPNLCTRRRAFCRVCIGGMTACSAGAVGFPVVTFLGFPQRPAADRPVEVPLDQLADGQVEYVDRRGQLLLVLARAEGPLVLSAACTHLGCNVIWDAAGGVFRCPCHGAEFDGSGAVLSGPVNKPLRRIPFEIRDGVIIVT